MPRGAQRALYDERRRKVLPRHGIPLVELDFLDTPHGPKRTLLRDREQDLAVGRSRLEAHR